MAYLLLVLGLALLAGGAEMLVRGSVSLAKRLGLPPLVIGMVLVGFGTSTPELAATVSAAVADAPGLAIGNVVGSNIANILLILGLAALLHPMQWNKRAFYRDGGALMTATALLIVVGLLGEIGRVAGGVFLIAIVVYCVVTIRMERRRRGPAARVHAAEAEAIPEVQKPTAILLLFCAVGLVGLLGGAVLVVDGATALARQFGIRESIIGLTVVALGTSLPEVVTSVVAALRREADVALGNVIGSNLFNTLGIAGLAGLLEPIEMPPNLIVFDLWVMLAATLAMVAFAVSGWRVNRWEGGLLLTGYGVYLASQFWPPFRALLGLA